MQPDTSRAIPNDVQDRLRAWHGLFQRSSFNHIFFSIGGLILSILATSYQTGWWKADIIRNSASILTPIFLGIVAFLNPQRKYLKFVAAWRILDLAAMRYRRGLLDDKGLCDAIDQGERVIAEFEAKEAKEEEKHTRVGGPA